MIAKKPELLGLGLDEPAAIVVQGDRMEVIGRSVVGIYDGKEHDGKRYYFLAPGEFFDLARGSEWTEPRGSVSAQRGLAGRLDRGTSGEVTRLHLIIGAESNYAVLGSKVKVSAKKLNAGLPVPGG